MKSIEIKLKKTKLAFVWLTTMGGFFYLGQWFLVSGLDSNLPSSRLLYILMGITLLLISVSILPFGLRLMNKAPGLIIDRNGLTDHSGAWQNGFVAWSDIKAIEVTQPEHVTMMYIILADPEKYLQSRIKIRRVFARMGDRFGYPSPFGIVIGNLNIEIAELVNLVDQYWGDFHQRSDVTVISAEEV